MARYSTTIRSRLAADDVWDLLCDVTRIVDWDPTVLDAVQVSGDGPGPAAAYELLVKRTGSEMELRYDVNEFSPPSRLFLVADTGTLRSEDEIIIEPDGDGCALFYSSDLRFGGFYSVANPLLAIAYKVIGWRSARGLSRYLDQW